MSSYVMVAGGHLGIQDGNGDPWAGEEEVL